MVVPMAVIGNGAGNSDVNWHGISIMAAVKFRLLNFSQKRVYKSRNT
jgi:hypothetical protein